MKKKSKKTDSFTEGFQFGIFTTVMTVIFGVMGYCIYQELKPRGPKFQPGESVSFKVPDNLKQICSGKAEIMYAYKSVKYTDFVYQIVTPGEEKACPLFQLKEENDLKGRI